MTDPTNDLDDLAHPLERDIAAALDSGQMEYLPVSDDEQRRLLADLDAAATGTEPSSDTVLVVTSLRLTKAVLDRVRQHAKETGVRPAALMRTWIEEGLVRHAAASDDPIALVQHSQETLAKVLTALQRRPAA